jgi:hypothetical protein
MQPSKSTLVVMVAMLAVMHGEFMHHLRGLLCALDHLSNAL